MQVVPQWRQPLLPPQTRRCRQKTLVLDLDETLVHSTLDDCDDPDFTFPVAFNGFNHTVHVKKRPGLLEFLQSVSKLFEVVIFTASQKIYAEQLLNVIDPTRWAWVLHRSRDGAVRRDRVVLASSWTSPPNESWVLHAGRLPARLVAVLCLQHPLKGLPTCWTW